MVSAETTTTKMQCIDCGGYPKNHQILHEYRKEYRDSEDTLEAITNYQICQCLGCDRIAFREASSSYEDIDEDGSHPETVRTYPEIPSAAYRAMSTKELPEAVARIYIETVNAINSGAPTLAGGGLRAIVEGICTHQAVAGRNLQAKIDDLVSKGLLARPQAELLHEERYIGNSALHELLPPTAQELRDGIKIVEGLMNTIYVLPKHADKLRKSRQNRAT